MTGSERLSASVQFRALSMHAIRTVCLAIFLTPVLACERAPAGVSAVKQHSGDQGLQSLCSKGGYWRARTGSAMSQGLPIFSEFRWFCDAVVAPVALFEGIERFCRSRDDVYLFHAWLDEDWITVDMTLLGFGIVRIGQLHGSVLVAPTNRGLDVEMHWFSPRWDGQMVPSLRDAERGFYPDIPECNGSHLPQHPLLPPPVDWY